VSELILPKPLPYQQEFSDHPAQRKQANWGRRTGKTRELLLASCVGHGPLNSSGERLHRGMAQGGTVVWVSLDYKQLKAIWSEEIEPRWGAASLYKNKSDWEAHIGKGRLIMRSAENPRNIRGAGKGVTGVVLDEAAHWDVQNALEDIINPIMLDEDAWLIVASTPNAASDGHRDEDDTRVTPSWFNRNASKILSGEASDEWYYSHADARLNPKITKRAWDRLIAEYPEGSLKLRQEVFAELLVGGSGFAFPEMAKHIHQRRQNKLTGREEIVAGIDWGYAKHGWIGVAQRTARGAYLAWERPFNGPTDAPPNRKTPLKLAQEVSREWQRRVHEQTWVRHPTVLYTDSQMDAVTDGNQTVNEQLREGFESVLGRNAPLIVPVPKGPGSRVARKMLLHTMLDYTQIVAENGELVMVDPPRLYASPSCTYWWHSVSGLVINEKDPEDVDTEGEDHGYDGSTYMLMAMFPDLSKIRAHAPSLPKQTDRLSAREDREYAKAIKTEMARIRAGRKRGGRSYE